MRGTQLKRNSPTVARLPIALTDKAVARLPLTTSGQYVVRDRETPGFFVVVGKTARTYTVQADLRRNRRRIGVVRMALGQDTEISASDARKLAKKHLSDIQNGIDPREPGRANRPGGATVADAWTLYKEACEKRGRSPTTIAGYQDKYDRHLKRWRDTPLRSLDRMEVADAHRRITRDHGPYTANGAMRLLRAIHNLALRTDPTLPPNPVAAVVFNRERRRKTGMGVAELPAWWAQLGKVPNPVRREMHLFTLLSGLRRDDVRTMEPRHIDVRNRRMLVPDPKGGEDRAFHLPLSRAMLRCLWRAREAGRMLYPAQARRWVFPSGESASGHVEEVKEKKLAKTGHALRHSFRTLAHAAGVNELDVKVLLNHKIDADVTDGYLNTPALAAHIMAQQEKVSRLMIENMMPRAADRRGMM